MVMELKLSQSCSLPKTTISKSSSSFPPNHFNLLALQKWKLHIQRISWKGQSMGKRALVHVVKEGETLSCISKLYGVPILEIAAANEGIVDVNLVLEGHHLNIPSTILGCSRLCYFIGNKSNELRLHKSAPSLGLFHSRKWNQIFSVSSSCRLSLAKTTCWFLVLVPLMAFCIRCIMGAFQNRAAKNSRNRTAKLNHSSPNSMRWRTVLDEPMEAESQPDSHEDQEELHFEEASHDYIKLEDDYQKFLTDCGMSNWGYWRGGSPQ